MPPRYQVLYVDDEPDLLEITRLYLEKDNQFSVDVTLSGSEALTRIAAKHYNAVISDYQMPGMDGITLLKKVRETDRTLPFILFTGRGREEVVIEAINSGVDFYLQKGGDPKSQFAELSLKVRTAADRRNSEKALKESEERYRSLIETTGTGYVIIDNQGRVITANPEYLRLTGRTTLAEIEGKAVTDWTAPYDLERNAREVEQCIKTGYVRGLEIDYQKPDGTIQPIEINASIIQSGPEQIILTLCRDISERRTAAEALQKSEDNLRTMIEQSPLSIQVLSPDGRTVQVNRAFEKLWGLTLENLKEYNILRDEQLEILGIMPFIKKGFAGEASQIPSVHYDPGKVIGTVMEKKWVLGHIYPVRDPSGTIRNVVLVHEDITERMTAELALKESEERYRAIAEFTFDWEYWVAPNGKFIYVSPSCERISGYRPEEFIADPGFMITITHPDDQERVRDHIAAGGDLCGKPDALEYRMITKSGEVRWMGHVCQPVFNARGECQGRRGSNRDITEQKQAELELTRKSEELSASYEQLTASDEELRLTVDDLSTKEQALRVSEGRIRVKLESLLSPEGDLSLLDLSDIIDVKELQAMMEAFTRATGMVIAILDTKGTVLVATGWQEICTRFHRVNPVTAGFCTKSDLYLAKNTKKGESVAYKCMNNLWDVVTPLYIGDRHMGNIFTGQFFYEDEKPDESIFIAQADKYGFDREQYLAALHKVPKFSREKINDLMEYLVRLTDVLSHLSFSNLKLVRTINERDNLLQSLRESEHKYRTLVRNIPDKIFVKDVNLVYVSCNEVYARDLGIVADAIPGKTDFDFFPRELAEKYRADDRAVLESGTTVTFEEQYQINGVESWISTTKSPLRDDTGNVSGIIGIFHDITERRKMEDALRNNEGRLRTLVQTIPDLIWLKNKEGVYLSCNTMFERFFGAKEADIVGKTDYDFVDSRLADYFRKHDLMTIAAGKSTNNEEWITFADDGHRALLDTIKTPMYDARGTLIGVLGIGRDITERKKIEEVLKDAKEYAEKLIQTANAMVVCLDINGAITIFNPAAEAITGYTSAELAGRNWFEVIVPKERYPQVWEEFNRLLAGGLPKHFENPIRTKSGEERYIVWKNSEIREKDQITGTISYGIDITERKQAEEALRESEEKFRAIFDSTFQFTGLMNTDGTLIAVNHSALDYAGIISDDVINKPFWDTSWWRGDEKRVRELKDAISRAAAGDFIRYEVELQGANDRRGLFDFSIKPVFDKDGKVTLLVPEGREIS